MKYNSDNTIERYKVRLIAQRFAQVYEIDYIETFTSIIRYKSLRIFLAIVAIIGIIFIQINVVRAYLKSAFN